ncbi:MAG: penicillin-binding protein 2 [bacterium]|nr:penicillin-binding protein 2 [bacterium]
MTFRFVALAAFFSLLYGAAITNLYRVQIERGAAYIERAEARQVELKELQLRRGKIFFTDRAGTNIPVAFQRDYPVVYAAPNEITDPAKTANAVAPLVGMTAAELTKTFSNSERKFALLKDQAPTELTDAVAALALKGIYIKKKQYRSYPFEALAAPLIGFVGVNREHSEPAGIYGLEKLYNASLARGEDFMTTIDRNLQAAAELSLEKLIERYDAISGAVLIAEPATGRLLTMASLPSFDPNDYSAAPVGRYDNPTVQYMYEPGSVMKPLTIAAGIDAGAITPETTYYDSGSVTLNGWTLKNFRDEVYHTISMTNVLEHSVNTGAVFAERALGHERFHDYLVKFGFGAKTGVDLPDEVSGSLKNIERKDVRAVDFATAAYGQGTAVTPIQLIAAFGALANGGLLMRPYLSADAKPTVVRRVLAESTAKTVTGMLESAVRVNNVAVISGYRVAGKTGTAYIPDLVRGGYRDEFIHTFIGYAPASDPKFVILVKLERPALGETAGVTVVPAFRELAQYVLNYYRIPPDDVPVAPAKTP